MLPVAARPNAEAVSALLDWAREALTATLAALSPAARPKRTRLVASRFELQPLDRDRTRFSWTEELEFRFIGDRLILMDVHAHIILDIIEDALPK